MPSKYRKRRRKKKQQPPVFDFELFFDDVTMTEGEGEYLRVKEIMETQEDNGGWKYDPNLRQYRRKGGDSVASDTWCIRTKLTIAHPMGEGYFILNLFHDRKIAIVQYQGNIADASYNPDIRCLTKWSQSAGWKIPEPLPELITESHSFWKKMWETLLIDSEDLDKRYGERKSLMVREKDEEEHSDEE